MSERMKNITLLQKEYLGKSPEKLINDYPTKIIRILFPNVPYTQDFSKDRINAVVEEGIIKKVWIG